MNVRAVFLLFVASVYSVSSAKACVDSVEFKYTPQYELYEAIKAESKTEEETIRKFSEVSGLGREMQDFREFEINKIRTGDLKKIIRKWEGGESVLAQTVLLVFAFSRADYIKEKGYVTHFEDFLRKNKAFCWLDDEIFYFKIAEYKLRVAQVYPGKLELEELVFLMREILFYSGEEVFLQDYFDLLRVGGTKLAKEELKSWSSKNQSDDFCNNLAHCIERIRIEFKKTKEKNSNSIQKNAEKFECEGKFVKASGDSILVDLCW